MARQEAPARTCERGRRKTPCDRGKSGVRAIVTLLLAIFPIALSIFPSSAAENNQGAQLAAMCAACHRLDGQDRGIPSIIGLDANKLAGMMAEFKSDKRKSQVMGVVARSLSDEEVAAVAHYLATRRKLSEQP
jgi:cytochrome c553